MAARFAHVSLQTSIMASSPNSNQEFEARIDIINSSKAQGTLVKVDDITFSDLTVERISPELLKTASYIDFSNKKLEPFSVTTVKINFRAKKAGTYNLSPKIVYLDDSGKTKEKRAKAKIVTVAPFFSEDVSKNARFSLIDLKSEASQKAFEYLADSFRDDYLQHRLPEERSGWRTLMSIVREGGVSKYSVYGSEGNGGQAISELQHAGLVETRLFAGERGRGGNVLKVRVAYEKEKVRSYIERHNK
jgi:hypothetical protein